MIVLRRFQNVAGVFGTILKWFGGIYLVPLAFALANGTPVLPFAVPLFVSVVVGAGLEWIFPDTDLDRADGFLLVVQVWFAISLVGSLPYMLSGIGTLASPINAIFEAVSGFSCTGSTVMGSISLETHSHAIMIWRQLTQWLGGMGILVLAVAILPRLSIGGAQFLDNEFPGPRLDRLTPHMTETARRLWILYVTATVVLFGLFLGLHYGGLAPKMDAFQALAHTFTTLPSGGFSPQGRSIEAFSPPIQWLLIPFMFLAAMNFALLWRALVAGPKEFARNTEFKAYLGLFVGAGLLVSLMLGLDGQFDTLERTLREGIFQVATILTTTGYASTDFAAWSGNALMALVVLMFVSGSVGSTSGGIKILRWLMALKVMYREAIQSIHPSVIRPLRIGKRVLKEEVVRGAIIFMLIYFTLFAVSTVVVALDTRLAGVQLEIIEIITSVAVTLGNIGPGVGAFGPMENFEFLPVFSKLWMCLLMIAGRLEIMSMLILLTPKYWRN